MVDPTLDKTTTRRCAMGTCTGDHHFTGVDVFMGFCFGLMFFGLTVLCASGTVSFFDAQGIRADAIANNAAHYILNEENEREFVWGPKP